MKDSEIVDLYWQRSERAIPNYRPLLEQQMEEARHIDPEEERDMWYDGLTSPITEAEVTQLYTLLGKVEHTNLKDETALSIIREEVAPFLAGERSAEDAARLIQSRISIYVSEQGE